MSDNVDAVNTALRIRLADVEATMQALLSGEIDAVIDPRDSSPVLLALAQKALRESEERYRTIVETANEGIWLLELDGTITFVNEKLATMLVHGVPEVVGRSLYDFLPDSFHGLAAARLARAPLGLAEESDSALRHQSGREIAVLVRTSPIGDASGGCAGVLAMITDTTRRSVAERKLRESEAEYRQIVESTTDGIIKLDKYGTIVFVNARFSEMLGYAGSELVGSHVLSVVPPAEHASVRDALRRREAGASTATDTFYTHRNGTDISVNIAGSVLRDETGQFSGVLGLVRDMTERNKLQAELIVSDRMASVGTLAAGVAHEINNPLAATIANLEFLSEGVATLERDRTAVRQGDWLRLRFTEPLADAREAAERVRRIVKDLMIFSRSPVDEQQWSVDVNGVLESSLRMAWNEIRHRAELVKDLADVPVVRADDARLGQVFLNLIVNAAQAIPVGHVAQHEIRVSSRRDGDAVVVEISDTGCGIGADDLERIFDAFYTTKPVGEGTGLGLAICRRIVTDMGGTLTVRSTPGVGSTFIVTLQVATHPEAAPRAAAPAAGAAYRGRVLVVDDEDIVARGVERALDEGGHIQRAPSADAALALVLGGERYDVILCDLMMPNMTGMELHDRLVEIAPGQARRMMFMTGGAFTAEARQFITSMDLVLLEKPFGTSELRTAVQQFSASLAEGTQ
ncbi:MAG: PAS domain S-box protein [Gemmatimonadaceae bacterium]|nr:PAS domain S-box protein [Gemmatimonadaceae bacterium]